MQKIISVFIVLSQFPTLRSHQPAAGASFWNLWFLSWLAEPFCHIQFFYDFSFLVMSGYFWSWPKLPVFRTVSPKDSYLFFLPTCPFFLKLPPAYNTQWIIDFSVLLQVTFHCFKINSFPQAKKRTLALQGFC